MADAVRAGMAGAPGPAGPTVDAEIHDLGYRRYEGTSEGGAGAWRALFVQGLRTMFGLGRPARAKVVPVFVLVATVLPAVATLAASTLSEGLVPIRHVPLVQRGLLLFALFVAAQAPELLSRDQQQRVLPLLLTRALTRSSYALARWAAVVVAVYGVALAPHLLLYVGEIGAAANPAEAFRRMGGQVGAVLVQPAMMALVLGGIGSALAAWTPRRAYATAAIIGGLIAAAAIATGLDDLAGISARTAELVDPIRALNVLGMLLFDEKTRELELRPALTVWAYVAQALALSAAGLAAVVVRMRRVQA